MAWFPSEVGDPKPFLACSKKVGTDPFKLIIKEAHKNGIKVHAWLNMLSLSDNKNAPMLKKYGPEILTRNTEQKYRIEDYKIDNQYFLEPGDTRVRKELITMVGEILNRYKNLDGIQFDYIRYPDRNPRYGYTKINMDRFKRNTGRKVINEDDQLWRQWKRDQVTELLKMLINEAKSIRPDIEISATGCMPYIRAYEEAFQDWPMWLRRNMVSFVTIMSYSKETPVFEKYYKDIQRRVVNFNRVNIGVGAYVMTDSLGTFKEQVGLCEKSKSNECVIFHYGSLCENPKLGEFLVRGK